MAGHGKQCESLEADWLSRDQSLQLEHSVTRTLEGLARVQGCNMLSEIHPWSSWSSDSGLLSSAVCLQEVLQGAWASAQLVISASSPWPSRHHILQTIKGHVKPEKDLTRYEMT